MADQTRIELAISSVTGRHVNRYTTDPAHVLFNHKTSAHARAFFENEKYFHRLHMYISLFIYRFIDKSFMKKILKKVSTNLLTLLKCNI